MSVIVFLLVIIACLIGFISGDWTAAGEIKEIFCILLAILAVIVLLIVVISGDWTAAEKIKESLYILLGMMSVNITKLAADNLKDCMGGGDGPETPEDL